jgi:hypothetical protein
MTAMYVYLFCPCTLLLKARRIFIKKAGQYPAVVSLGKKKLPVLSQQLLENLSAWL